jgi:hypothetical protein
VYEPQLSYDVMVGVSEVSLAVMGGWISVWCVVVLYRRTLRGR